MKDQPNGLVFFNMSDMGKYFLSEIFTLVPGEVFTPQIAEEALVGQFSLNSGIDVSSYMLEKEGAVVVFPSSPALQDTGALPFVVKLLEEADAIEEYNKVIFHYCSKKKLSHTIIYAGEELKLVNSFRAESFESALYFLFLSIKGLQMNPRQCTVQVCCAISLEQEEIFARFFKGFKVNNLDIHLQQ